MAKPNGFSNMPQMTPRPFKHCPYCGKAIAGGETKCYTCAQTDKGVPHDVLPKAQDLPNG